MDKSCTNRSEPDVPGLPRYLDIPPWQMNEALEVDWQSDEWRAAKMAVNAYREHRRAEQARDEAADTEFEEFIQAYQFAARIGLAVFIFEFFKALYWNWRFGLDPVDQRHLYEPRTTAQDG